MARSIPTLVSVAGSPATHDLESSHFLFSIKNLFPSRSEDMMVIIHFPKTSKQGGDTKERDEEIWRDLQRRRIPMVLLVGKKCPIPTLSIGGRLGISNRGTTFIDHEEQSCNTIIIFFK